MKNSICLPIPTAEDSPVIPVRCFAVYESGSREMVAYPFTRRSIRFMNEARFGITDAGSFEMCWCTSLFFPELWPPELIKDYLESPRWQPSLFDS